MYSAYDAAAAVAAFSAARHWNLLFLKALRPEAFSTPVTHPRARHHDLADPRRNHRRSRPQPPGADWGAAPGPGGEDHGAWACLEDMGLNTGRWPAPQAAQCTPVPTGCGSRLLMFALGVGALPEGAGLEPFFDHVRAAALGAFSGTGLPQQRNCTPASGYTRKMFCRAWSAVPRSRLRCTPGASRRWFSA